MAADRERSRGAEATELVVSLAAFVVFVVLALVALSVEASGSVIGLMLASAALAAWRSVAQWRSKSESR
ncbi:MULTISPECIES: hypothetical protein [unclassified Curtobacterium]|uniref:hypothetical protein n=1 Tax=unclassified Curtobacterium TaxID=257496 RepID=UPI00226B9D8A|nr:MULTISPECIES: hypothetical protein [unclassified Curtobacterium]